MTTTKTTLHRRPGHAPAATTATVLATTATVLATAAGADDAAEPVELAETVITASRTDRTLDAVAGHVSVIDRRELDRVPAQTLDDALRQTPAFGLFRRSSSQVAHPTSQGVSLRGIGGSGASRTLVLLDGMPLNDPFGGWVQWGRVSRHHLQRVEILRGGGAHLWGNQALGGVIYLLSRPPAEPHLALQVSSGNRGTGDLAVAAARPAGSWNVGVDGHVARTDGYPTLRADQRGTIDEAATSENGALRLRLQRRPSATTDFSAQAGFFAENRTNGTPLTDNGTRAGFLSARARWKRPHSDCWTVSGTVQRQRFESAFSSQAADRKWEDPALEQFDVPATAVAASVEWVGSGGGRHQLAAGSDWRWTRGETNEDYRNLTGAFSRRRRAGGDELITGAYLQDSVEIGRWLLALGSRLDLWRSTSATRRETDLETGERLRTDRFADRTEWFFGPRAGLRYAFAEYFHLRGNVHRSFRAPTLNELYRPFRVRNDITEANAELDLERLLGLEAGLDWFGDRWRGQLSAFWNRMEDGIVNMTLAPGREEVIQPCGFVPEDGSCRQRRNVDRIRFRGLEAELAGSSGSFSASLRYLFTDSAISRSRAQPELEGRRLLQVPRHRLAAHAAGERPGIGRAALYLSYTGAQFEDDVNTIELGSFAVVGLALDRPLGPNRLLYASVGNLLDSRYAVGETASGLVSEGAPRLVRVGLRSRF